MKMSEKLQEIKKDNKGFSLVELIIVIAIMAILIGIVGMNVIPQIENARRATDAQVISALVSEAMEAWTQVDSAARTTTLQVSVGSDGALTLSKQGGENANLETKFEQLAFTGTGENRKLKSDAGQKLGKIEDGKGITIHCDMTKGVYIETLTGFEGYEFESR